MENEPYINTMVNIEEIPGATTARNRYRVTFIDGAVSTTLAGQETNRSVRSNVGVPVRVSVAASGRISYVEPVYWNPSTVILAERVVNRRMLHVRADGVYAVAGRGEMRPLTAETPLPELTGYLWLDRLNARSYLAKHGETLIGSRMAVGV